MNLFILPIKHSTDNTEPFMPEPPLQRDLSNGKEWSDLPLLDRLGRMMLGLLALTLIPIQLITAQDFAETIRKTARFQDTGRIGNTLRVYNIHGSVTVVGYDGTEVRIAADKKIFADSQHDPDRAGEELQLVTEQKADLILIYIDAPFIHVKKWNDRISYNMNSRDKRYDFLFDITVQVPRNTTLHASTINRGKIVVENIMGGELSASNVNGEVELKNVAGTTLARTVNGDITASYSESPRGNSSYKTVNGTIEVLYPDNLSADIRFKSLHGDLYTDFQNVRRLRARVETDRNNRRGATTYRIDKFSPVRIGEGGPELSFEVLNGDVYVKRIKS